VFLTAPAGFYRFPPRFPPIPAGTVGGILFVFLEFLLFYYTEVKEGGEVGDNNTTDTVVKYGGKVVIISVKKKGG
jgi:hypothetical protein